jgi:hypothetical protein
MPRRRLRAPSFAAGWPSIAREDGALILGRTPTGRATVAVRAMNARPRLDVRRYLIDQG